MKEVSVIRSRFLAAQADWLIYLPYNLSVRVLTPYPTVHICMSIPTGTFGSQSSSDWVWGI